MKLPWIQQALRRHHHHHHHHPAIGVARSKPSARPHIILSHDLVDGNFVFTVANWVQGKGLQWAKKCRWKWITDPSKKEFFLLFLCQIKRALTSYKMVCNHLLTTHWSLCRESQSHLQSLVKACCVPELCDRVGWPTRSRLSSFREESGTTERAGVHGLAAEKQTALL